MRWFAFGIFLTQLIFVLIPTCIALGLVKIWPYRAVVGTISLLILISGVSVAEYLERSHTPPPPDVVAIHQQAYERLHTQQPTHRDVLYNLSLIYQSNGDFSRAKDYVAQAQKLDPNASLFSNDREK